ncbi:MAG: L-2-amino-thiazoline-4-carboxylic acid hydrolase [Paracoccaceae bacterium]
MPDPTQAPQMDIQDIPILLRRKIEAMLMRHVLEVITERSGRSEAEAVIGAACSRSAIEQGQELAKLVDHTPNLEDFHALLPAWSREDALRLEDVDGGKDHLEFNVTRCRYAELYQAMGLRDIGHLLSCNRDGDLCVGYNPDIELTRTQTIMQGASHCDFRFRMNADEET